MNAERKSLMEIATEGKIKVNKFWSTEKLAKEVNAGIAAKERRSDALRRAWDHRRALFGQIGISPESLLKRRVSIEARHSSAKVESLNSEQGEPSMNRDSLALITV